MLFQLHNIKELDHWIQGKDENTPFGNQLGNEMKLLLRGSQDRFTIANFHRLCDNNGTTVSIIKVEGTGQLIGGYNSQLWHSGNAWLEGKGSFIFSLGNGKVGNTKLSKFVGRHEPYGGPNDGPQFGGGNLCVYSNVKRQEIMSMLYCLDQKSNR
ncbi:hypothetical protein G9A89_005507 [Geosiphon pyriformis]|nr:hypothetical protein G9A89_005507 [Geosiphon pyriformis]